MPHPELINTSGHACELLVTTDEAGRTVCAPLIQATFRITPQGALAALAEQPPIKLAGEWRGDPAFTSMRLEPQVAFMKPATDIVLLGHAYPNNAERTEGLAGIRVGSLQKVARIFGDRRVVRRLGVQGLSAPEPFEKIELCYERAFGGWDRRDSNAARHSFEPRNPVGLGYRDKAQSGEDDLLAPNIEDPAHLYQGPGDKPPPMGFGFVAPDWSPRAAWAGTYDQAWNDTRKPLLPKDFDRRFFNAASPGLVAPGYLAGDEAVAVIGMCESGRTSFTLPGLPPPACRLMLKSGPIELQTALDTLVIDMDQRQVALTWRAHALVPRGVHDVVAVELPPQPPVQLDDED